MPIAGLFSGDIPQKNINQIINKIKKNKKIESQDKKIGKIILEFIKIKKLVIYGGYAIHLLLKNKTGHGIYNEKLDLLDFDIYSTKFDEDSLELARILKKNDFHRIRIISGITGKTRKIFVNLESNAIVDISLKTREELDKIQIPIGEYLVACPQHIKIDHYMQLSMNFLQYHWRLQKTFDRVKLLEINFPITNINHIEEKNISKESISLIDTINNKYDVIIGGDYIFNKLYDFPQNGEIFIYSNDIIDEHIPVNGISVKNDLRLFPIIGEIFFINNENQHWVTKSVLIYTYYVLKFYYNTKKYDWKIKILVDDFIKNSFEKNIEILKSKAKYIEESKKQILPTEYLTTF